MHCTQLQDSPQNYYDFCFYYYGKRNLVWDVQLLNVQLQLENSYKVKEWKNKQAIKNKMRNIVEMKRSKWIHQMFNKGRQIKYEKSRKIMVKHEENKSVSNSVKDGLNARQKRYPSIEFYLFIYLFIFFCSWSSFFIFLIKCLIFTFFSPQYPLRSRSLPHPMGPHTPKLYTYNKTQYPHIIQKKHVCPYIQKNYHIIKFYVNYQLVYFFSKNVLPGLSGKGFDVGVTVWGTGHIVGGFHSILLCWKCFFVFAESFRYYY